MEFEFQVYTPEGATLRAKVNAKNLDAAVDMVYSGNCEYYSVDVQHAELLNVSSHDGEPVYLRSKPDVE